MKKCFKFFDLFPLNFKFNIKNNQLIQTLWGGVFSLLLILLTLALILYNTYTYFKNHTPIVLYSQKYIGDHKAEEISLDNFNFINFLTETTVKPINLNLLSSGSIFISINLNPINVSKNSFGNFDKCSNAKNNDSITLVNNLQNTLKVDSQNFYCFNKYNSIDNIELGGNIGTTEQLRQIQFYMQFDLCSYKDIQPGCTNSAYLKQLSYIYNLNFYNYYSDMTSDKGYVKFKDFYNILFSPFNDINVLIKLQKNIVYSDDNYLFNFFPITTFEYYSYSTVEISTIERQSSNTNYLIFRIMIEMDKYQNVYNRTYMKLDQLLSNTLSIFSVLLLICKNLTKFVEYRSVEYYLMKKLYYFNSKRNFPLIRMKNRIQTISKKTSSNLILKFRYY